MFAAWVRSPSFGNVAGGFRVCSRAACASSPSSPHVSKRRATRFTSALTNCAAASFGVTDPTDSTAPTHSSSSVFGSQVSVTTTAARLLANREVTAVWRGGPRETVGRVRPLVLTENVVSVDKCLGCSFDGKLRAAQAAHESMGGR
jgi:hypothetical protein